MSWKNPAYSGATPRKILVIGMSQNPEIRADFEDDLASAIAAEGREVIPGNHILFRPDSSDLDPDYLKGQIRDFKIDAVLVSRLVKVEKKTTYYPGTQLRRSLRLLSFVLRLLRNALPAGLLARLFAH